MTETHRQRGDMADEAQALETPDDVANIATEVIDLSEAPPIVPAPPLELAAPLIARRMPGPASNCYKTCGPLL